MLKTKQRLNVWIRYKKLKYSLQNHINESKAILKIYNTNDFVQICIQKLWVIKTKVHAAGCLNRSRRAFALSSSPLEVELEPKRAFLFSIFSLFSKLKTALETEHPNRSALFLSTSTLVAYKHKNTYIVSTKNKDWLLTKIKKSKRKFPISFCISKFNGCVPEFYPAYRLA